MSRTPQKQWTKEDLFAQYPEKTLCRFKEFHKYNPDVYKEFEALAKKMITSGRERYSARTIAEVIRWDRDLNSSGNAFKLNGDFVPIYVRLLIYKNPEFNNFFELRSSENKSQISIE